MKLPTWLGHIIAFIMSVLAAFFAVFNVLFSDIFGFKQQAGAVLYVLVVYFVLSVFLHWLWRSATKKWMMWLVIPGGVFALFIIVSDRLLSLYPLAVLVAMALGSWLGRLVFRRPAKA